MLLLFSLSIMSKQVLHDLIADHVDYVSVFSNNETSINQAGFQCDCDDLVVSSPYVGSAPVYQIFNDVFHDTRSSSISPFLFSSQHTTKDLRGPPATV